MSTATTQYSVAYLGPRGSFAEAARRLGMHRRTLARKLEKRRVN